MGAWKVSKLRFWAFLPDRYGPKRLFSGGYINETPIHTRIHEGYGHCSLYGQPSFPDLLSAAEGDCQHALSRYQFSGAHLYNHST
jgi:phenylalanine-4-hydroxylase